MTLSITTLSITTFSIMTFSIKTLGMTINKFYTQHNEIQHYGSVVMLSFVMQNVANNAFLLNVVMLSVAAPL